MENQISGEDFSPLRKKLPSHTVDFLPGTGCFGNEEVYISGSDMIIANYVLVEQTLQRKVAQFTLLPYETKRAGNQSEDYHIFRELH